MTYKGENKHEKREKLLISLNCSDPVSGTVIAFQVHIYREIEGVRENIA